MMNPSLPPRPTDATLSVTKAARLLGVHPNTVRAWSDAGRLRYYRINPRGDRRYRLGDLQRFLAAAEHLPQADAHAGTNGGPRRPLDPATVAAALGTHRAGRAAAEAGPSALGINVEERHGRDLALLDRIARTALTGSDLDDDLGRLADEIREAGDHTLVVIWERRGERLTVRAAAVAPGSSTPRLLDLPRGYGVLGRALDAAPPPRAGASRSSDPPAIPVLAERDERVTVTILPGERSELAAAIPGADGPWGALLIVHDGAGSLGQMDQNLAMVLADAVGTIVGVAIHQEEVAHLLHRAEALRRVAGDIGSRLDLDRILSGLVDHAMVLFEADRAAVFLRRPDGDDTAEVSRGLSAGFLNAMRSVRARTLPNAAVVARRPLFSVGYRDDPRGGDLRAAVVQEGFDTACAAPLMDGPELLGILGVYHERPTRGSRMSWTRSPRWRPRRASRSGPPRTIPARDMGGTAPVHPGARCAPESPDEREGDRQRDRHGAPRAHRLPQRPCIPARRR